MDAQRVLVVRPGEGGGVDLPGLGVDFKVGGESTGGRLSIVEHPMEPGRMTPPHVHHREDELSCVLEGPFGVRVGEEVAMVGPGRHAYKPAASPTRSGIPARLVELIWPGSSGSSNSWLSSFAPRTRTWRRDGASLAWSSCPSGSLSSRGSTASGW